MMVCALANEGGENAREGGGGGGGGSPAIPSATNCERCQCRISRSAAAAL